MHELLSVRTGLSQGAHPQVCEPGVQGAWGVYSDSITLEELRQIRRDVNASFFKSRVIFRLLKKMVIHRLLTAGLINKIAVFTARRKIEKMAKKRGIRMGRVMK